MKNILVIGSGGREHALCWAVNQSTTNSNIFCAPGNAGIADIAQCINIAPTDVAGLVKFAITYKIDLTIVGGETSLALGVVNAFEKQNLKIVGPSLAASRLESSKSFAKDFMLRYNIPTAPYRTADSADQAISMLQNGVFGNADTSVVIKADGLAAGKGVIISENRLAAIAAVKEIMLPGLMPNNAAKRIILEQRLTGREVSLLLFTDGKNYALMPPARDHKRIGEGDTGANTGGMGAITDKGLLSEIETQEIVSKIIDPTLIGATSEGFTFRGILFLGLMMTDDGAKLLEYNVRFGDPEAQTILVRLKSDFVAICESISEGWLDKNKIEFNDESSACVVLASRGYPAKPETGDLILGLEKDFKNVLVFHSATQRNKKGDVLTAGGRVLSLTAKDKDLTTALRSIYRAGENITWEGMQFRRDIGASS